MALLGRLILAYLVAEFVLVTPARRKGTGTGAGQRQRGWTWYIARGALLGVVFTLAVASAGVLRAFWPWLILLWATQMGLDEAGARFGEKTWVFGVEQFCHLASIALLTCMAPAGRQDVWEVFAWLANLSAGGKLVPISASYVAAVWGGAAVVGRVCDRLIVQLAASEKNELVNAGRYVGMLERAIIATFTMLGDYRAIAFVLTAKSIARFRELEDRRFSEYYLIGTLTSALIGIAAGLAMQSVLG